MKKKNVLWGILCLGLAVVIILSVAGVLSIPIFAGISTGKLIATVILGIIFLSSLANLTIEAVIISGGVLLKLYEEQLGFHISVPMLILVIFLLIMAYNFLVPAYCRHH